MSVSSQYGKIGRGVMLRIIKITTILFVLSCVTTNMTFAVEPEAPEKLISRIDAIAIKIHNKLAERFKKRRTTKKKDQGTLVQFYAERDNKPVWISEKGINNKALLLMNEIKNAAEYELNPNDYVLPNVKNFSKDMKKASDWLAKTELQISYAALAYARHAGGGRISPGNLSKYIDRHPQFSDPFKLMSELSKSEDPGKNLRNLHPSHPQFKLLLTALRQARTQKLKPVRHIEIPEGPTLRLGDSHENIPLLRKRLNAPEPEVSYDNHANAETFDIELQTALKKFQKAKGLEDDGILGPSTRRILNRKPGDRTKTLLVNLERWRWMPRNLGNFHIRVNIPEFKFRVVRNNVAIHTERTIVGKYTNQTPVFSDQMETVVFNPYWYPTYNIIRNEILPGARKSGRFIAKNGFEVTNTSGHPIDPESVDWYSAGPRDFSFRQPPGASNALGEVKFLFPNKHAVYLHDTPTKHLFNTSVRAYSHGCMRIRNPRRLAEIIMGNEGWSSGRVNNQIDVRENQHYSLKNKFPVHITYFTAWANPDGSIQYFDDIYKHDKRIYAALNGLAILPDPVDPVAARAREQERNINDGLITRRPRFRHGNRRGRGLFSIFGDD